MKLEQVKTLQGMIKARKDMSYYLEEMKAAILAYPVPAQEENERLRKRVEWLELKFARITQLAIRQQEEWKAILVD